MSLVPPGLEAGRPLSNSILCELQVPLNVPKGQRLWQLWVFRSLSVRYMASFSTVREASREAKMLGWRRTMLRHCLFYKKRQMIHLSYKCFPFGITGLFIYLLT